MKKSVFFLIFILIGVRIFSQSNQGNVTNFSIAPQGPQADAIKKNQIDVVDYSKGTVSVRVPIAEFPMDGLNWPLMLSYNSRGVKVGEIASNVGLGWSFNNIGTISSKVMSRSDVVVAVDQNPNIVRRELNLGSAAPAPGLGCSYTAPADISDANLVASIGALGGNNFLPDIFYLNIGELNYKFFLKDTIGYTMPASKVEIRLDRSSGYKFRVKDLSGVVYYLSMRGGNWTVTNCPGDKIRYLETNGLFCVDSIRTPMNDFVRFYYSTSEIRYDLPPNQTINLTRPELYTSGEACRTFYPDQPFINCSPVYAATEVYLDSLVTSQGTKLGIVYSTRNDLPNNTNSQGRKIDRIEVFNDQRKVRLVDLTHSYFGAPSEVDPNLKRLKLDAVEFKNVVTNQTEKTFSFDYDGMALPGRLSFAQDSAGYYNGQTGNPNLIPQYSNRSKSLPHAQAGALKKITYPEGGSTTIEYELNILREGGLRVKSVKDSTMSRNIWRVYKYTSPWHIPYYNFEEYKKVPFNVLNNPDGSGWYSFDECDLYTYFSAPYSSILDSYEEVSGFYPKVEEWFGENGEAGKNEYYFSSPPEYSYASVKLDPVLYQKIAFKNEAGVFHAIEKEQYVYQNIQPSLGQYDDPVTSTEIRLWGKEFKKIRDQVTYIPHGVIANTPPNLCYPMLFYQTPIILISHPVQKFQTRHVTYSASGDSSVTVTEQYYNNRFQPNLTRTYTSLGERVDMRYRYAHEFNLTTPVTDRAKGIKNLQNRGMLDVPVETYTSKYVGTTLKSLLSADFTSFDQNYPSATKRFRMNITSNITDFVTAQVSGGDVAIDSRYELVEEVTEIGERGKPKAYTLSDGSNAAVVWDKYNIQPVAVVQDALAQEIAYTSFESSGNGGWTFSGAPVATDKFNGAKSYVLSAGSISKGGLNTAKQYVVSFWSKAGSVSVSGSLGSQTGIVVNGWSYIEHIVTGVSTVVVSGSGFVDDLRLFPRASSMKTYNYDYLVGMTSESGVSSLPLFYEYDGFNRLIRIRDKAQNIIKQWEYLYRATLFSNSCATQPNWSATGVTRCQTDQNNNNTGVVERQLLDLNPCSVTYNQFSWEAMSTDIIACPLCSGDNKKVINGICETGIKICTGEFIQNGQSKHYYHYKWSDNSTSPTYIGNGRCLQLELEP